MIFIIVAVMWIISICICIILGGADIGKNGEEIGKYLDKGSK